METTAYFLMMNGDVRGPYSLAQLRSMWAAGTITSQTTYSEQGSDPWLPIEMLEKLLATESLGVKAVTSRVVVRPIFETAAVPPPLPNVLDLPSTVAEGKPKLGVWRLSARILLSVLWPLICVVAFAAVRSLNNIGTQKSVEDARAMGMTAHEYGLSVARVEAVLGPLSSGVLVLGFVVIWLLTRRKVRAKGM